MQLTKTNIQEFQEIIKADYGVELSYEKASEDAYKLIQLMGIILELSDQEGGDVNVKRKYQIKTSANNRGSRRTM